MAWDALDGRAVAVWGAGREGRAVVAAWQRHLPGRRLVWIVRPEEVAHLSVDAGDGVTVLAEGDEAAKLEHFQVVVKSPGISLYRPDVLAAQANGVGFSSGSALWFATHAQARTICVTGTKGKSTTSALLAHLLRAAGVRTALAGNIGLPLLDLEELPSADWHVIELSSFQTADLHIAPDIAVLTSLVEEHLDWHGDVDRYRRDKLRLFERAGRVVAPAGIALSSTGPITRFGQREGWHVAGEHIFFAGQAVLALSELPLPGRHNAINVCAALTVLDSAGFDARALVPHLRSFRPLPHRLQWLGERDGVGWVNDSIATTPDATVAAWQCWQHRPLAIIVGGHERGLDWHGAAAALSTRPPHILCVQGANRARVSAVLQQQGLNAVVCADLAAAVAQSRQALVDGGVVLLAPGSPSFPDFSDYTARGRRFAALAGFDGSALGEIGGLGVA